MVRDDHRIGEGDPAPLEPGARRRRPSAETTRSGPIDGPVGHLHSFAGASREHEDALDDPVTVLAEFRVASEPGRERGVTERVRGVGADLGLSQQRLDGLETAVAEATMNAIEHGNHNDASLFVGIRVWVEEHALVVRVTDDGRGREPAGDVAEPDIEAKLRGEQSPRGRGLFLIRKMVDDLHMYTDDEHHIVELVLRFQGHGA